MREILIRCAKTVLPTATAAGVAGYFFAQGAGAYIATERDSGQTLAEELTRRVPYTMAAWCGGMVLVFELFRSIWGSKPKPGKAAEAKPPAVDAEQLLLQLLDQAEAAEERRSAVLLTPADRPTPTVADDTPPPVRTDPLPMPDLQFPVSPPGS